MENKLSETIRIQVRFSEVDAIQMVWHGHYLLYLEDAREAFGRKYGLAYKYIQQNGYLAPIYDIKMQYKGTATIDDLLEITINYIPAKGGKLMFDYEIRRQTDNKLIMTATTIQLFTDLQGQLEPACPEFLLQWKEKNNIKC